MRPLLASFDLPKHVRIPENRRTEYVHISGDSCWKLRKLLVRFCENLMVTENVSNFQSVKASYFKKNKTRGPMVL